MKYDLIDFYFVCVRWAISNINLGFSQHSLGIAQNGVNKKMVKHPVKGSSVSGNVLLMREVRREWTDCFKLTAMLQ